MRTRGFRLTTAIVCLALGAACGQTHSHGHDAAVDAPADAAVDAAPDAAIPTRLRETVTAGGRLRAGGLVMDVELHAIPQSPATDGVTRVEGGAPVKP